MLAATVQLHAANSVCRRSDEELLLADSGIHSDIEKAHHHLGPGLFAPDDCGIRIGVVRIILRVIKSRNGLQGRAALQWNRVGQPVAQLPEKVVMRNPKQGANSSMRLDDVVLEGLASKMHVREEA